MGIYKPKTQTFNRDNIKTLFNHFLLRVISLCELGVKTNAKPSFKTQHLCAQRHS